MLARILNWVVSFVLVVVAVLLYREHGLLIVLAIGILLALVFLLHSELSRLTRLLDVQGQKMAAVEASLENLSVSMIELRGRLAKDDLDE